MPVPSNEGHPDVPSPYGDTEQRKLTLEELFDRDLMVEGLSPKDAAALLGYIDHMASYADPDEPDDLLGLMDLYNAGHVTAHFARTYGIPVEVLLAYQAAFNSGYVPDDPSYLYEDTPLSRPGKA